MGDDQTRQRLLELITQLAAQLVADNNQLREQVVREQRDTALLREHFEEVTRELVRLRNQQRLLVRRFVEAEERIKKQSEDQTANREPKQ